MNNRFECERSVTQKIAPNEQYERSGNMKQSMNKDNLNLVNENSQALSLFIEKFSESIFSHRF